MRLIVEHESKYESQWAAIGSVASKIGCTAETLRKWVRQAEHDQGRRDGMTTSDRERLKALARENARLERRLAQAEAIIEIQKKVSAILGRPLKGGTPDGSDS